LLLINGHPNCRGHGNIGLDEGMSEPVSALLGTHDARSDVFSRQTATNGHHPFANPQATDITDAQTGSAVASILTSATSVVIGLR